MIVTVLDDGAIAGSIELLAERVRTRRDEIASLSEELRRAEKELELLLELARLGGIGRHGDSALAGVAPSSAVRSAGRAEGGTDRARLVQAVVDVLRVKGSPMHIQDLVAGVRHAGVEIPGRGSSANLIAHIRTDDAIVRPVRGMYGLREWGLREKASSRQPGSKRATSRRRAGRGRSNSTV